MRDRACESAPEVLPAVEPSSPVPQTEWGSWILGPDRLLYEVNSQHPRWT
jgi:hypothetical protein